MDVKPRAVENAIPAWSCPISMAGLVQPLLLKVITAIYNDDEVMLVIW